jgi:hypothetical protein
MKENGIKCMGIVFIYSTALLHDKSDLIIGDD